MLLTQAAEAQASSPVLDLARKGDLAAFDQLMRLHEPRVFSLALRFTGSRADAEELTQDVFIRLHATLSCIADDTHLLCWLLRAISHRCLNRIRDAGRRPKLVPLEELTPHEEPAVPLRDEDPLANARLRRLILELSPDARAVMLLRYQQDLDPSEISTVLTMPLNSVKSHLRRSLAWLREQIGGEDRGS